MNPSPDHQEKLERAIHRTLRELPPRRAPRALEERVLAEIARRAALPWWRRSFMHWPLPARAGFLAFSTGIAGLVLTLTIWGGALLDSPPLHAALVQPFIWLENGRAVFDAIRDFGAIVFRHIPPLWFYAALAFVAAMYAAFFGLGAAAYKALHSQD